MFLRVVHEKEEITAVMLSTVVGYQNSRSALNEGKFALLWHDFEVRVRALVV